MSASNSLHRKLYMTGGVMDLNNEAIMDPTLGLDGRHPGAWNHENACGAPVSGTDELHMSHYPAVSVRSLEVGPSSVGPRPGNMVALSDGSTNCIPPFVHHNISPVLRPLQQTEYPYSKPSIFHSGLSPYGSDYTVDASCNIYPDYSVLNNTYANQPGILVSNHIDTYDVNIVRMPFATTLHLSNYP
jgi:hypothetical protein